MSRLQFDLETGEVDYSDWLLLDPENNDDSSLSIGEDYAPPKSNSGTPLPKFDYPGYRWIDPPVAKTGGKIPKAN
ncbi:MAG: hypothetical protein COA78_29620 [Blastopirellula sp.]|nr:MAG: hypothetical protein COA78_29620 [Blastopirellula sp.]